MELCRYYLAHAKKIVSEAETPPDIVIADRILGWLTRNRRSEFTKNEAFQSLKGGRNSITSSDQLDVPLQRLHELGWIRYGVSRVLPQGGRPSAPLIVHKTVQNRGV